MPAPRASAWCATSARVGARPRRAHHRPAAARRWARPAGGGGPGDGDHRLLRRAGHRRPRRGPGRSPRAPGSRPSSRLGPGRRRRSLRPDLRAVCRHRLPLRLRAGRVSHWLAEDITAETFLRALRRIDELHLAGAGDIGAWFVTIARNLVTDYRRSSRFKLEVTTDKLLGAEQVATSAGTTAPAAGPEQVVLSRARDRRLVEAVKGLRPDQQECLVLRFFHEFSVAETAKALGRSRSRQGAAAARRPLAGAGAGRAAMTRAIGPSPAGTGTGAAHRNRDPVRPLVR